MTSTMVDYTSRRRPGRFKIYCAFALIVLLGVAIQVWAALQGRANFNGDEAIWGLMARHILLQRQIPVYFYGQSYLGTWEALFTTLFLKWMGHSNVVALRIVPVLLFGGFLILYGILLNRVWGKRVALLSLVVLTFPGLIILWTATSVCAYGTVLTLGTGALWCFYAPTVRKRWSGYIGWLAFGFIVGFGLWIHPITIVYFVAIALVYGLQTPEWLKLYTKLQTFCEQVVHISWHELAPVVSLGLFGLGVVAFFATDCEPRDSFATAQHIARILLLLIGGTVLLITFWGSTQRKTWLARIAALGIGGVIGNLPQWKAWLFFGVVPDLAMIPTCPTGILPRLRLVVEQLIPAMWGIPSLQKIFHHAPERAILWIMMLALTFIASITFIWTERFALWALISWRPLSPETGRGALQGILLGLPVLLLLLGNNIGNVYHVRYLIISWQANAVILALFLLRLVKKSKILGMCLIGLWIAFVGFGNLVTLGQEWQTQRELNSPQAVAALEDFLAQHQVTGGYADYWIAYPLDFLTEERLTFAPYNALDRYPLYSQKVAELPVRALLLPVGSLTESATVDDAVKVLEAGTWGGPAFSGILEWLRTQTVVQRQIVAQWDVWVLADL